MKIKAQIGSASPDTRRCPRPPASHDFVMLHGASHNEESGSARTITIAVMNVEAKEKLFLDLPSQIIYITAYINMSSREMSAKGNLTTEIPSRVQITPRQGEVRDVGRGVGCV